MKRRQPGRAAGRMSRADRIGRPDPSSRAGVAERLHAAAIHLLRRVARHDRAMRLGRAQASALSVLVFGGPLTAGALARVEQVQPPTMSRIVDGLVREGLAERVRSPADRRQVQLRATARGTRRMQEGRARRLAALLRHMDALSPREQQALGAGVEVIEAMLRRPA